MRNTRKTALRAANLSPVLIWDLVSRRAPFALLAVLCSAALAPGISAQAIPEPAQQKIDFDRDVWPVLESKCFSCHGAEKQLAGLRLDRRQLALRGGDYGKVILPGKSLESKLILRLLSSKEGLQMPPTGPLESHQISILRAWIDQGADYGVARNTEPRDTKPETPALAALLDAIARDDQAAIGKAISSDRALLLETDRGGATPLMHAAGRGSLAAMKTLLTAGAKVDTANRRGATALFWALGEPEKVRLLLAHKASVQVKNSDDRAPLHNAAHFPAAPEMLAMLLEAGANPNARDTAGMVPLHLAAVGGNAAAIKVLLAAGAKPAEAALNGTTPLMQAVAARCGDCVRLLIDKGADAKAVTKRNVSALGMAAYWGDPAVVKLLIEKGAPVNLVDADGYTPLKFAAYSEFAGADVVGMLLAHGADPAAGAEETALELAALRGETDVVKILRRAGKAPAR
ncbi:MAG: ankyrin repeat domain-containing protein [Acidobacteriia bacterium]|nr:ankyrin repeat domain-containing protein [Terriglobia bacterium]